MGYKLVGTYTGNAGPVQIFLLRTEKYSALIHILEGEKPKYRMEIVAEKQQLPVEEGHLTAS